MRRFEPFHEQLAILDQAGRKRKLMRPRGRDFSSNDYLGLARSEYLKTISHAAIQNGIPHGSGGSRLLGGNHDEHEHLETFAAEHYGAQAALFFSSGYSANLALFSTLPQRNDLVVYDAWVHASTHDGMKLGRAICQPFEHNDLESLTNRITSYRQNGGTGTIWIAVESLYSMDGDQAPLAELAALADRHDAILIIDEAHAVGIFGADGKGLSAQLGQRDNMIILRTCGKALGVEGGLITMAAVLRDFFINRARAFIFSTAPSPLTAHLVRKAIVHIAENSDLPRQLHGHIAFAEQQFSELRDGLESKSQILPILIGNDRKAVTLAERLQSQDFDVRAIRPPTVPAGTARLRISLTLNVSRDEIAALAQLLTMIRKEEQTI
ncbi:MAG: 8-amino-7-oxononanoate synthase [Parasphingorhabdus sp.]|uniref:8-amino-7-oxononanoate synthase n=1 Tax=Parasphingorhabdus sp. TaxID=2709688 RepID=UPI0032969452